MSQTQNNIPDKKSAGDPVDPEALMGRVNGLSFLSMLLVSVLVHSLLIGVTSVTYIRQCMAHGTLYPDAAIREQVQKERTEERRKKRAERQAADAKQVAEQKSKGGKSGGATTKPVSKIEQNINRKSTTLPAKSGVSLDDIDEL